MYLFLCWAKIKIIFCIPSAERVILSIYNSYSYRYESKLFGKFCDKIRVKKLFCLTIVRIYSIFLFKLFGFYKKALTFAVLIL